MINKFFKLINDKEIYEQYNSEIKDISVNLNIYFMKFVIYIYGIYGMIMSFFYALKGNNMTVIFILVLLEVIYSAFAVKWLNKHKEKNKGYIYAAVLFNVMQFMAISFSQYVFFKERSIGFLPLVLCCTLSAVTIIKYNAIYYIACALFLSADLIYYYFVYKISSVEMWPLIFENLFILFFVIFINLNSTYIKIEEIIKNRQIEIQRDTDSMTGVYNRFYSVNYMKEGLKKSGNKAFIIMDVDNFKKINDTFGHDKGDEIIIFTANTLTSIFSENSCVSRMGGDEFSVFVEAFPNREYILNKIENLIDNMRKDITVDNVTVSISCSVGVDFVNFINNDYNTLYRNVDKALYHSKKNGKDCYTIYSNEL